MLHRLSATKPVGCSQRSGPGRGPSSIILCTHPPSFLLLPTPVLHALLPLCLSTGRNSPWIAPEAGGGILFQAPQNPTRKLCSSQDGWKDRMLGFQVSQSEFLMGNWRRPPFFNGSQRHYDDKVSRQYLEKGQVSCPTACVTSHTSKNGTFSRVSHLLAHAILIQGWGWQGSARSIPGWEK